MAADLTADLREAEAEGGSTEDVLGSSAFDPKAFAASWAFERGVTGRDPAPAPAAAPRKSRTAWAFAAFAAVAIVGALLLAVSSRVHTSVVAAPAGAFVKPVFVGPGKVPVPPGVEVKPPQVWLPKPLGVQGAIVSMPDDGMRKLGGVLLILGIAGLAGTGIYRLARYRWQPSHQ
jgi:hypothetical protein